MKYGVFSQLSDSCLQIIKYETSSHWLFSIIIIFTFLPPHKKTLALNHVLNRLKSQVSGIFYLFISGLLIE